jgi:hypothetical protein
VIQVPEPLPVPGLPHLLWEIVVCEVGCDPLKVFPVRTNSHIQHMSVGDPHKMAMEGKYQGLYTPFHCIECIMYFPKMQEGLDSGCNNCTSVLPILMQAVSYFPFSLSTRAALLPLLSDLSASIFNGDP